MGKSKIKLHICEGCGDVERLTSAWPPNWKGYGTSAYRVMPTAEWCPDCIAIGVMQRDARVTAEEATAVLIARCFPKYKRVSAQSVDAVDPHLESEGTPTTRV